MNDRDISIIIQAYQKSVIEGQNPPKDWQSLSKLAIKNHAEIKQWILNGMKEND